MTEANIEQIVKAINELDELAIGFSADAENGGAHLDFIYSGLPGTQVAQSIAAYAAADTKFAGCMRDNAAMRFNMSVTSPPELVSQHQDQMKAQMASLRQQFMNAIEQEADLPNDEARQTIKDAANELMDAFEATAMAGRIDMAGHVDMREGAISMVAGGFAKDTSKIESAIKKLAALVEEDPSFPGVQWNADSHRGAQIHTMSIPIPADEAEAREMLGEQLDVAVAMGTEVVYVAAGEGCLSHLKQAMDGSGGSSTAVKPMQLSIALTPILQLAAQSSPNPLVDSMIDALVTKSDGNDQVHMTAEAVDGKLRARLELEKGVLEAIGAAAQSARQQGAAARF